MQVIIALVVVFFVFKIPCDGPVLLFILLCLLQGEDHDDQDADDDHDDDDDDDDDEEEEEDDDEDDGNEILLHQGALLSNWGVYEWPDQLQGGEFDILTCFKKGLTNCKGVGSTYCDN